MFCTITMTWAICWFARHRHRGTVGTHRQGVGASEVRQCKQPQQSSQSRRPSVTMNATCDYSSIIYDPRVCLAKSGTMSASHHSLPLLAYMATRAGTHSRLSCDVSLEPAHMHSSRCRIYRCSDFHT